MQIDFNKVVILDGAMGTMLQKHELYGTPELYSITNGDIIEKIHTAYVEAGAKMIYANTFGANALKLKDTGYSVNDVITASVKLAKNAASDKAMVGLDIGPTGELLAPRGTLSFNAAYDIFKEVIISGTNAGADFIIIETMTDIYEVKAAVLAAKENCTLPIYATMSFEQDMRTFLGVSPLEMATILEALGVNGIGLNCSLGPDEIFPIAKQLSEITRLPIIIKPNAGLPNPETGEYNISAADFCMSMSKLYGIGACMLGGCCGTSPEFIKALSDNLGNRQIIKRDIAPQSRVCSSTKTIIIDRVVTVGERINPTGRPLFQEALKSGNLSYVLEQAVTQKESGADILDINAGFPGINEAEALESIIREIQSVVDCPLQIDSSDTDAIEAALRIYNGKPIINSVTGEKEELDKILPLAKKYGAAVIALTLDEDGIPKTAEGRVKIAEKIINAAEAYGILKEDIFIDCLVLAASSQQNEATVVLEAIKDTKALGVKTLLGVTNISFGLPERTIIDHTFLVMGLTCGADIVIFNHDEKCMMDAIDAFNVISNKDNNCEKYIKTHNTSKVKEKCETELMTIERAVLKGLTEETKQLTTELLKTDDVIDIIDNKLIPALDIVGQKFETGETFLPQLLQSAVAAQGGFQVIEEYMHKSGKKTVSKGKLLLATVKGDIHDIGKNIVKTILENYGYEIYDLGKNVDPETIVNTAKQENIRLVGLSALMTTSLKAMAETITALRDSGISCKICVGGAVLTAEYAKKIGADYYAKDAKEAIDIAKQIF